MVRTQIQLPDDVYRRARKVCRDREISLAELDRRGLEYMLSVYAGAPGPAGEWQPPQPRHLGWTGLSDAEIKEQAQRTAAEAILTSRSRK